MADEKSRAQFEAAYAKRAGCDVDALRAARWGCKGYRDPFAAAAWFGWIDSRAALVIELPQALRQSSMTSVGESFASIATLNACRDAIRAAGVNTK